MGLLVPHATENGTDHIVRRDEGNADKADCQIVDGAVNSVCRGGHEGRNGLYQGHQNNGEHYGNSHKDSNGIANACGGFLFVIAADGLADKNRGTHGKTHDHDGEHVHDLGADGNSGRIRNATELADDVQVSHSIQGLQQIGKEIRQRENQNVLKYAATGQIFLHI